LIESLSPFKKEILYEPRINDSKPFLRKMEDQNIPRKRGIKGVPMETIFRGMGPFLIADVVVLILLPFRQGRGLHAASR
jgi:hypothetical protein